MKIISVNVGQAQEWHWKGKSATTAVSKTSVQGHVHIGQLKVDGDQQVNLEAHGGPYKAVYGYASEAYGQWRAQLPGVEIPYGSLGENLTTEGLNDQNAFIGDHLRVGTALLAVAQPRIPCFKLQFRFQREDMIVRFLEIGQHGFYFAVIEEGDIVAGSPIELVHREPHGISIADVVSAYYRRADPELVERVCQLESLAPQFRAKLMMKAHA